MFCFSILSLFDDFCLHWDLRVESHSLQILSTPEFPLWGFLLGTAISFPRSLFKKSNSPGKSDTQALAAWDRKVYWMLSFFDLSYPRTSRMQSKGMRRWRIVVGEGEFLKISIMYLPICSGPVLAPSSLTLQCKHLPVKPAWTSLSLLQTSWLLQTGLPQGLPNKQVGSQQVTQAKLFHLPTKPLGLLGPCPLLSVPSCPCSRERQVLPLCSGSGLLHCLKDFASVVISFLLHLLFPLFIYSPFT